MSCSWEVLCTGWPAICNICGMIAGCLPEGHLRSGRQFFRVWAALKLLGTDNKTCNANYSLLTENKKSYTVRWPETSMGFITAPVAYSAGHLYSCICSGSRPVGFLMMPPLIYRATIVLVVCYC